jgi:hypothetical protein
MAEEAEQELSGLIDRFVSRANEELHIRWTKWPLDLSQNEVHEVAGSLLARQVTLATQLARSPPIWNGHTAPIILRAMADVFITVAWILKVPIERSRKFIFYGLGQAKLSLEHRRAELKTRKPEIDEIEMLDAQDAWINRQRATFLTDVNLGSWSGISTRGMAEEADCIDFYNYVYSPFSGCAHSTWQHVAVYNLKECTNPLHRMHAVPNVPDLPIDLNYLYLAGKYLQKTFRCMDEAVGTSIEGKSAFDLLCEDLKMLGSDDTGVTPTPEAAEEPGVA